MTSVGQLVKCEQDYHTVIAINSIAQNLCPVCAYCATIT
jgi:hypothetical protein